MKIIIFFLGFVVALSAANNRTEISSFINFVSPKVVPYSLGVYRFDTLDPVAYPLNTIFPSTARKVSVTVFIRSGMNNGEAAFNVWLWTECSELGTRDTKFKRGYRYHQSAYAFDSETLEFVYCSSNPDLYVVTDNQANNVQLELYVAGYTNIFDVIKNK